MLIYYTLLCAVSGQSTIKWCTISEAEESKCKAMSQAFTSASIRPAIQCVRVSSKSECAQKLIVSLSMHLYFGRLKYNLQKKKKKNLKKCIFSDSMLWKCLFYLQSMS